MLLRGGLGPCRSAERVQRRCGYVEVARVLQDVSGDVRVSCNMLGWSELRLIGLGLHMPLEQRELLLLLNQLSWTCTTQQHQQQQEQQEQRERGKRSIN